MEHEEEKRLLNSLIVPGILLAFIWIVKISEVITKSDFSDFGILPQTLSGLKGILFSPFIHANYKHLAANSVPLFVLTAGLFYYYRKLAWNLLTLLWSITGLWVWVFAKDTGYHIGASGVIYALAGFHFTSGIIRKDLRMMAFTLLVVFLYGSLIWGIIPDFFPGENISWQSHLLGLFAGVLVAFFYKNEGPQRRKYDWEDEEDDEDANDPGTIPEENVSPETQEEV
jgi:membrane associated rhomboid family serine protease